MTPDDKFFIEETARKALLIVAVSSLGLGFYNPGLMVFGCLLWTGTFGWSLFSRHSYRK